jgi:hypothetical protein
LVPGSAGPVSREMVARLRDQRVSAFPVIDHENKVIPLL